MRKKIVQQLDMYLIAVVILASSFLANNAVFAQQADSVKLLITKPVYRANLNKHDYFVGGTLSLNSKEIVNKDALVLNIDDQLSNSISLGIDAGYALKDNLFVGLGVDYGLLPKKAIIPNRIYKSIHRFIPIKWSFVHL